MNESIRKSSLFNIRNHSHSSCACIDWGWARNSAEVAQTSAVAASYDPAPAPGSPLPAMLETFEERTRICAMLLSIYSFDTARFHPREVCSIKLIVRRVFQRPLPKWRGLILPRGGGNTAPPVCFDIRSLGPKVAFRADRRARPLLLSRVTIARALDCPGKILTATLRNCEFSNPYPIIINHNTVSRSAV